MIFEDPYSAILRRVLSSQGTYDKLNCGRFATMSACGVASSAFNTTELQTAGALQYRSAQLTILSSAR